MWSTKSSVHTIGTIFLSLGIFCNCALAEPDSDFSKRFDLMRRSLSTSSVITHIMNARQETFFDIGNPFQINVYVDPRSLNSSSKNATSVQYIRLWAILSSYADVGLNVTYPSFGDGTGSVPFDPGSLITRDNSHQTINVFSTTDIIERAKKGEILLKDIPLLNKEPVGSDCYVERNQALKTINIFADLRGDASRCLYFSFVAQLGTTTPFSSPKDNGTDNAQGFRTNVDMMSAYAIRACIKSLFNDDAFSSCLKENLTNGN